MTINGISEAVRPSREVVKIFLKDSVSTISKKSDRAYKITKRRRTAFFRVAFKSLRAVFQNCVENLSQSLPNGKLAVIER